MSFFDLISPYLFIINIAFAAAVIFLERRNVGVTWAWLMVLFFLPGAGFVLYLILGQNLSRRKIYKLRVEQQEAMEALLRAQLNAFHEGRVLFQDPAMAAYQDLIHMNLLSGYSFFTQDNEVEIFTDGASKFDSLLEAIEGATHHIHLMYYIVQNDTLGRTLVKRLAKKAQEGVQVRFLYDDIGSSGVSKRFFRELTAAGGQVAAFFPSKIRYLNLRLNYRNHRKLAVIDGAHGYIGGFNVGDEYLGLDPRFGEWRDTHLKVTGSAVWQMQAQFYLDWHLASPLRIPEDPLYFPSARHTGTVGMQVVSSGPNRYLEPIRNAYIKMILAAKRNVSIQSPYFIPDESLLTALKMAALSGVDVRIMIPKAPDHKLVGWASRSYLDELLAVGVKFHLYEKGFLHAKMIVVDSKIGSVGTANIDIRSFKLNFEVNAFVYDTETAGKLQRIFEQDAAHSSLLTLDDAKKRPLRHRLLESCARLLSPIL